MACQSFDQESCVPRPRAHTTGSMKDILNTRWPLLPEDSVHTLAANFGQGLSLRRGKMGVGLEREKLCRRVSNNSQAAKGRRRYWSEYGSSKEPLTSCQHVEADPCAMTPPVQTIPHIWVGSENAGQSTLARHQRTRSLPSLVHASDPSSHTCLTRLPSLNARASYQRESLRCVYYERLRHASGGSVTSNNDEEWDFRDDGGTSIATYNVSSASSMGWPALKLMVLGATTELRTTFLDQVLMLGDAEDDDDVFLDDVNGESRSAYMSLNGEEYHVTMTQADYEEVVPKENISANIILAAAGEKEPCVEENILSSLHEHSHTPTVSIFVAVNAVRRGQQYIRHSNVYREVAAKYDCIYLELRTMVAARVLELMEEIVSHVAVSPQRAESDVAWRVGRRPTVVGRDEVDKTTLFNRFFWRTLTSRSYENLMAL